MDARNSYSLHAQPCSAGRSERGGAKRRLTGPIALIVGIAAAGTPSNARADQGDARSSSSGNVPEPGTYTHLMMTASAGASLRFNNPFRLSNQLGNTGESLSRTPPHANLGGGASWGNPDGWQHGLSLQWSRSMGGLPQHVVTPAYLLVQGGWRPWLAYARAGTPFVLNPDRGVGGELGLGGAWMFTAGLGLQAELIGDVFYGAATWDKGATTVPMLSMQIGLIADCELLP